MMDLLASIGWWIGVIVWHFAVFLSVAAAFEGQGEVADGIVQLAVIAGLISGAWWLF